MQFGDHFVVFRVVLEAAAGINSAGQAQTIQLAHELTCGVDLLLQRQFWAFCQCRVEDHGIRAGNQHTRWVAVGITLDFATRRVRRVFGVADDFQCGAVQQRTIVQVKNKHRRIRRRFVDLIQGWHTAFRKLELIPAPHHTYPLRIWGTKRLLFQHA